MADASRVTQHNVEVLHEPDTSNAATRVTQHHAEVLHAPDDANKKARITQLHIEVLHALAPTGPVWPTGLGNTVNINM